MIIAKRVYVADRYMTMLIESLLAFEMGAETTIDDVVEILYKEKADILSKMEADHILKADSILISDNIEEDIEKIVKASRSKWKSLHHIDYLEGIAVWEPFEYTFTPSQFLKEIGYK